MPKDPTQLEDQAFEDDVRHIARLIYSGNDHRGAANIDGRERDGVFVTEHMVVVIEATRSTRQAKASEDGKKLNALVESLARQHRDKAVRGFFITEGEPTAHQRDEVTRVGGNHVSVMSLKTFESKLVDATLYISLRMNHQFGSAVDPVTQDPEVQGNYVSLDLLELPEKSKTYSVRQLVDAVRGGQTVVLTGDFGIGKSMTLREVFVEGSRDYRTNATREFFIHINLREHQGQDDPLEALERHARSVGFSSTQLVSAWRAGRAHLLLDGFDEIANPNWPGRVASLKDVRRRSVALVRHFVEQSRSRTGILIAGRSHFFEDDDELTRSLGLRTNALRVSASDFTEAQVTQYLQSRSWGTSIPSWLPPRPLLIGHLAAREALQEMANAGGVSVADAGSGWDFLIDILTAREARIDIGVDGQTIRSLMEELATRARKTSSGLGPLSFDDITSAFQAVSGYIPDPESYVLLQRLPGLQVAERAVNSRMFVDEDFTDALRAGSLAGVIQGSANQPDDRLADWQSLLGDVGLDVCTHLLSTRGIGSQRAVASMNRLSSSGSRYMGALADILRVELARGVEVAGVYLIENLVIPSLEFAAGSSAQNVTFADCLIEVLVVDEVSDILKIPFMRSCTVTRVDGVAGFDEIALGRFEECDFGEFSESTQNMAAILGLPLSDENRVVLSALRKLFVQPGKGRKVTSFYRGALSQSQRELVPVALERLRAAGFAKETTSRGSILWTANRGMKSRAEAMLASPTTSKDPLLGHA